MECLWKSEQTEGVGLPAGGASVALGLRGPGLAGTLGSGPEARRAASEGRERAEHVGLWGLQATTITERAL